MNLASRCGALLARSNWECPSTIALKAMSCLLWRSLFGEKHFVRSLKAFHHCELPAQSNIGERKQSSDSAIERTFNLQWKGALVETWSLSLFVPLHCFRAGLRIDRHASFQAGQLASAAAPSHGASAAARTKTVLRDVSGVGQRSVTDTSLSHCIVFRHAMLLWRFVLGSFCVSVAVLSNLEPRPQAGFRSGKKKKNLNTSLGMQLAF